MDSKPVQATTPKIGPACLNCRFWQALPGVISMKTPITLKTQGECHRRAPKAQLVPHGDGGGFGVQGLFPPCSGADWCGEHEPEAGGPTLAS